MRVSKKVFFGIIGGLFSLVLVVGVVVWAVPIFTVKNFEVEGIHQLDAAQVREAAGVSEGENLLRVDAHEAARGVASLDWADSVTVSRDLPSTLNISVQEHRAVAFVKRDDTTYLIDDKGQEFISADPPEGAVELTGGIESGSTAAKDAVSAIAALSDEVRHQVATLEVTDSYSLQFITKDDRRIFWGVSDENNDDKARAFETVLKMGGQEWNISNPELVTTRR
ncbi:FtsQ-type POTRA domain-containing protein [Corynebacterium macginleyi]|uniref:FtsQ-type POTRA domain-containing protein n=1 Tax=Corynebacterium macginleyi TaxID=38290 RepID=A0ABS1Y565_9CORY|nr:FtsQ-type POTRA domain-containing protein [Corynebacterium macginleyi]MBK4150301.1 FtsQ-type POTRA domain-containing protein [Corynebacterium macginleyi]MBK4168777.1 FtsQ-type POTRA domain-containing protein [Corynebacterium macginleyi]MBK4174144.1 FtsQ-type POTRA domain-containing protein [Corynebacterium macginleyi]MBM0243517.1 FtsQ-type POTRA domain-containing protein [Corynebacterium macginleyi]